MGPQPRFVDLEPIKIWTGRYKDCQNLCKDLWNSPTSCHWFNFYTEEYEGEFRNYCVLFQDTFSKNFDGKQSKDIDNKIVKRCCPGTSTATYPGPILFSVDPFAYIFWDG